jgi:hypothetical protein
LLLAATEPPPLLLAELLHSEVMIVVIVDAPVAAAEAETADGTVGNCPAALAVIVVVAACGLSGL